MIHRTIGEAAGGRDHNIDRKNCHASAKRWDNGVVRSPVAARIGRARSLAPGWQPASTESHPGHAFFRKML
jgi:hypothetical protein